MKTRPSILIGPSIRGDVKVTRRNVLTGEIDLVIEKKNMLLSGLYQDSSSGLFTNTFDYNVTPIAVADRSHSITSNGAMHSCSIGTSNVPPTRSDTGIKGTILATSTQGTTVAYSPYGTYPVYLTRKWEFPAGEGTGNIGEVFLKATKGSFGYSAWFEQAVARQVFDPVIEKTDYHELTVEWTITMTTVPMEGDIPNGQRDGSTTVHWKSFINNRQLWAWAFGNYVISSYYPSGAIRFTPISGAPTGDIPPYFVITGDSNVDSDLENDLHNTLKGNQLYSGFLQLSTTNSYITDSYYRDFRLGFDVSQSNGQIGELLLRCRNSYSNDRDEEYICRITFDPPLDKTNKYQLYLDLRLGFNLS